MLSKPLIINNWQQGMALSDYVGFGEMRCVDILSRPGTVRVNSALVKNSTTIIQDMPIGMAASGNVLYCVDGTNDAYKYGSPWVAKDCGLALALKNCRIWKGYLVCVDSVSGTIRCYSIAGDSWTSLDASSLLTTGMISGYDNRMSMIHASDDKLYMIAGNIVASLAEVAGKTFLPTDGTTFTFTQTALDLPTASDPVAVREVQGRLMIAVNNQNSGMSDIFPWNKTDASYDYPISLGYEKIQALEVAGNKIYILAGEKGNIYYCDGLNVFWQNRLPDTILSLGLVDGVVINPEAVCYLKQKIYFGTSCSGSGTMGAIWSFDPLTKAITVEHIVSTGITAAMNIGTLLPFAAAAGDEEALAVGWEKTSTTASQGVDIEGTAYRYSSYAAYIISPFYILGDNRNKVSISAGLLQLAKPLITGEGVKIEYITYKGQSWQTYFTLDTAGKQSDIMPALPNIETIQFKISLTTPAGSDSTPELFYLKFI